MTLPVLKSLKSLCKRPLQALAVLVVVLGFVIFFVGLYSSLYFTRWAVYFSLDLMLIKDLNVVEPNPLFNRANNAVSYCIGGVRSLLIYSVLG
jgi:hypothetical protein